MWFVKRFKVVALLLLTAASVSILFNNCAKGPSGDDQGSSAPDPNDIGANFSGRLISNINYISNTGQVWGYAYDPENKTNSLKIIFYVDGPVGTGQFAGETQANVQSVGPNAGHFFSFNLPPAFANGQSHMLYAYGVLAKPEHQLNPMSYVSYSPKAEAVYNQQLNGFVQSSCAGCHSWNYAYLFSGPLMNPKPSIGGTATSNLFFRKMSGMTGHSGGTFCPGGQNAGICAEIQKWWNAEFN